MLAIVQRCPAPDCDSEVRYVATHRGMSRDLIGSCRDCGRRYRLVNGRPAEVARTDPGTASTRRVAKTQATSTAQTTPSANTKTSKSRGRNVEAS